MNAEYKNGKQAIGMWKRLWLWFDDLTGLGATLGPVMTHLVPRAKKTRWFYVLGSATLVVFLVQVITGIALSNSYVAGSGQAYESLHFITQNQLGRILRGIHDIGASAMIILIGLHAIRVYLMGAYKYPRQMNWLTGAGLLLFTILMAFTGQLLRWDQNGFWTAVVAAEQAGKVPIIGPWLAHFLLAGDTAGGATLSRFFAAHVFFIPACIFVFLGLHLYLVLHNGISEPPKAGEPVDPRTYRRWYHRLLERDGVPFWPDAAWRDLFFGMLVVITIVVLAIVVGPAKLGKPPDPTIIQASPRPDWYFLWYFALLTLIPNWIERWVIVLGPLVFGLFLILLPLLASRGERSPLRRPWSILVVVSIVAMIGYYTRMGFVAPWAPRLDAQPLPAQVVGATSGPVAAGAKLFRDKGCEFCHAISGYGGIRGPDLTYVGERLKPDQIETRIFSGAANMPSYSRILKPEELRDLLAFLDSRRRLAAAGAPPPAP
jgi:ubiquinol-cytochrome c reductase cytochrome b subunit